MTLTEAQELQDALARSRVYKLFAQSFTYPGRDAGDFAGKDYADTLAALQHLPEEDNGLLTSVRQLLRDLTPDTLVSMQQEYARLFAHLGSAQCPPYETEFGYDNVFQKAEGLADIAGFYIAYGLDISSHQPDRVDFLGTELEFMAYLQLHEAYAREGEDPEHLDVCLSTQRKFLCDHLGRWVPTFAEILAANSVHRFYASMGLLLRHFVTHETKRLGIKPRPLLPPKGTSPNPDTFACGACSAPITIDRAHDVNRL